MKNRVCTFLCKCGFSLFPLPLFRNLDYTVFIFVCNLLQIFCLRWEEIILNALYTSTSAVCVTGLTVVDAGDTFTALGQFFLAVLIQIGGLGVTSISAGVILAMGRRVNLKGRMLIRESMNLDAGRGLISFVYTGLFPVQGHRRQSVSFRCLF